MDDDNVDGGDSNREDCQMEVIPSTPLVIHINNDDRKRANAGEDGMENDGVELDDITETQEMQSSTLNVYIK